MNRRFLLTTASAALMTGGWMTMALAQEATTEAPATEEPAAEAVGIPDMIEGNPDATVEVIEYASYTCPHCASFHGDQYQQLKANYIDTGKIKFVYREVYFDRFGLWASMIARCGGSTERFFGLTEVLFEKQSEWAAGGDPVQISDNLRTLAKVAGLNDEELDACMADGEQAQGLVDWFQTNATRDGIESTPSFMINGEKYSNMSYDDFAALLDEKLAE